ncbi:PLP-dependent lyase/thiolase [Candidatus Poriferisocius sp.]|uniref:PLP-dependent lyase/thiolase n=1 Tax=Candidatus Poriferisocius sp. TaxID=3101276 RepID=UPI003B5BB234
MNEHRLVCSCGAVVPGDTWACPRRGDGADHVLVLPLPEWSVDERFEQPFVRYRRMLRSWVVAGGDGADGWFIEQAQRLDDAVAGVDGHGFTRTPCTVVDFGGGGPDGSPAGPRPVTVKDETGNVAGSHKARHTFGLMLHLLGRERAGHWDADRRPTLAIASCGNAAVAAAVVAAAQQWPITVFVPVDAEAGAVARLKELEATVEFCPRLDGESGDPSYLRFQEAVQAGAVPFGCQGPDNGYTLDGGRTLGYELAEQAPDIDRLYIQVGGGALAASLAQGLAAAGRRPALMAVQAEGCAPLERAWTGTEALGGLKKARRQRSAVMWPWTPTPASAASGILDDETYDWAAIVEAMADSGGAPLVVPEELVVVAHRLGTSVTGIPASPTGTAGLAGLLHDNPPPDATPAVIFTGVER